VLASVHPRAALEVFEKDCLITLGTCVAARGTGKVDAPCFRFELSGGALRERGELKCGDVRCLPLGPGESVEAVLEPARGFDLGSGPGKRVECRLHGGEVGIILDARGRPLVLPARRSECRAMVRRWSEAFHLGVLDRPAGRG
jgi:hypothetical protein